MNTNFFAFAGALAFAASASAQVLVTQNITTSTTWTANNVYSLQQQIYVTNGATLTIQAGTRIESTAGVGGSLAVTRGSKIEAKGHAGAPIVFTSTNDNGTQRIGANEWGNLTVMGDAYISEDMVSGATNSAFPAAANFAVMEGLQNGPSTDTYGGGNDNDNSGTISYCSFRFGGRVIALTNELNGLSLGGIGRNTTINNVEIYNNVDDGIEIWGGTVSIKKALISHVGDDSFDVDQGWRGTADQICIVQGYSTNAKQGSGHGDNAFEVDGAEQSDYQPRTRAKITNATVIGAPQKVISGIVIPGSGSDHATAWRDGAGVQYRNCLFVDVGQRVISFDNVDGDGGAGYGHNGTPDWPAIWSISAATLPSVNAGVDGPGTGAAGLTGNRPQDLYTAQDPSGTVCEMTDCAVFNATATDAYTVFNSLGLGASNVTSAASSPITAVTHGSEITTTTGPITRVDALNAQPQGDALTPNGVSDTGHNFRGAFAPGVSWANWTALAEYGVLAKTDLTDVGGSTSGVNGNPVLAGSYNTSTGATTFSASNAAASTLSVLVFNVGPAANGLPVGGGLTIAPRSLGLQSLVTFSDASGNAALNLNLPTGVLPGLQLTGQFLFSDAAGASAFQASGSNGVQFTLN